jgi:hypothetical protein
MSSRRCSKWVGAEPDLPNEDGRDSDYAERLAFYLADMAHTWTIANPSERNRLARELFDEVLVRVLIKNTKAVVMKPRPDFDPFLEQIGRRLTADHSLQRKRRDSNPRSQLKQGK